MTELTFSFVGLASVMYQGPFGSVQLYDGVGFVKIAGSARFTVERMTDADAALFCVCGILP